MNDKTNQLPQLGDTIFLGEAGLETDLLFNHGLDLPDFAAFPLLENDTGRRLLTDYFQAVIDLARRDGCGVVVETATWRANHDWGHRLGYSPERLDTANRSAVGLLMALRADNPDV